MQMNKQHAKQIIGLSLFAGVCLALGMGLSAHWVGRAQEDKPVSVETRDIDRLPPIAQVAERTHGSHRVRPSRRRR